MTQQLQAPAARPNLRASRRQPPKGNTKVRCFKGSLGLGANLAVSILDLSETGIRLHVKASLPVGQEVEINLDNVSHRPVKALAKVVWSAPIADGTFCIGARFLKPLGYSDLAALTRT